MIAPITRVGLQVTRDRYSVTTGFFTPAANPTDVFEMICMGSRAIRVVLVELWAFATTAGTVPVSIQIRSATDTGGAPVNPTRAIHTPRADTGLLAIFNQFTANPGALGAAVGGPVCTGRLHAPLAATSPQSQPVVWNFEKRPLLSLAGGNLRHFCINLGGAALPAGFQMCVNVHYLASAIDE